MRPGKINNALLHREINEALGIQGRQFLRERVARLRPTNERGMPSLESELHTSERPKPLFREDSVNLRPVDRVKAAEEPNLKGELRQGGRGELRDGGGYPRERAVQSDRAAEFERAQGGAGCEGEFVWERDICEGQTSITTMNGE